MGNIDITPWLNVEKQKGTKSGTIHFKEMKYVAVLNVTYSNKDGVGGSPDSESSKESKSSKSSKSKSSKSSKSKQSKQSKKSKKKNAKNDEEKTFGDDPFADSDSSDDDS